MMHSYVRTLKFIETHLSALNKGIESSVQDSENKLV